MCTSCNQPNNQPSKFTMMVAEIMVILILDLVRRKPMISIEQIAADLKLPIQLVHGTVEILGNVGLMKIYEPPANVIPENERVRLDPRRN